MCSWKECGEVPSSVGYKLYIYMVNILPNIFYAVAFLCVCPVNKKGEAGNSTRKSINHWDKINTVMGCEGGGG